MKNHALEVQNVSHWFGSTRVLHDVNLKIEAGQIVALVGPSGSGKTTLLRAILGTHPPLQGKVFADGVEITKPSRRVGIVYQHYSLYDFLSARDNVALGLKLDQTALWERIALLPKYLRQLREYREQATEFLQKVGLAHAADRYPSQMSGGMKQRVALAQALILKPKIVLLDEPFGALDESMREELQLMLLKFYQENLEAEKAGRDPEYTILIVTHELNEALYVSNRVIGISQYHADGQEGATIVYDRSSPIFRPEDPRDFSRFIDQREELRKAVFDPQYIKDHKKYVTFWDDLAQESQSLDPVS